MVYKVKSVTVDFTFDGQQATVVVSGADPGERSAIRRVVGEQVNHSVVTGENVLTITCPAKPRFNVVGAIEEAVGAEAKPAYPASGLKGLLEEIAGETAEIKTERIEGGLMRFARLPKNPAERTIPILLLDVDNAPAIVALDEVSIGEDTLSDIQARLVWKRGSEATYILEAL